MSNVAVDWEDDLEELVAAEEFLNYFEIPYEESVVHVNRLHILQRFHDYLAKVDMPDSAAERKVVYKTCLAQAYVDFVESDALTEKVFRVFHMHEAQEVKISVDSIRQQLA